MSDSIEKIICNSGTIAVAGLSADPTRPSNRVAKYLLDQGYKIIPVNPTVDEVFGLKSYPDLLSVPEKIDMVDIFRRSPDVPPIVEQAISVGAKAVWMQEGIVNEEAAERARATGLDVVMDRCVMVEHMRLAREGKLRKGD